MSDDLITRLEKATGPDRELDELIERYVHNISGKPGRILLPFGNVPYTSSINDALTLVPKEFNWAIGTDINYWDNTMRANKFWAIVTAIEPDGFGCDTIAPTPAIALCIAALRARAANV